MADESDILVHPSREESFCVAIADAMAMGLPVIAGEKSGAVPWLLDHGKCGVLVDVNNPKAIAAAMVELAGNSEKCDRLRSAARKRAEGTFRIDVVRDQYLELYKKIIDRDG
jgi:glycosyltransferase involved in cell wall biosynthesis